ncbi:hypothetical protein [Campylobacter concisus]|uniref:hypothetical protein n=1 Tax=Campylobacter concisus TaxID=199 RepID=UPI00131EBE71|nr:hypothetical protein [Campylobacter concisus]
MTDKEIVLELTKALLEKQSQISDVFQNPATASKAVAKIFNTIAENIKPALDKLKDHK